MSVAKLVRAEMLLERALAYVDPAVAAEIECAADLREGRDGQGVPVMSERLLETFADEIRLVRDLHAYLGTPPAADPDWFDELIEGSPS